MQTQYRFNGLKAMQTANSKTGYHVFVIGLETSIGLENQNIL